MSKLQKFTVEIIVSFILSINHMQKEKYINFTFLIFKRKSTFVFSNRVFIEIEKRKSLRILFVI